MNNDLISETAERLGRGEDVAYDNSPAVGEDDLMNYAARSGGLSGLADAIGSSAARLARSYESLGEADRARAAGDGPDGPDMTEAKLPGG